MKTKARHSQEHIGLSPYALVFRGQKKTEKTQLRVINFDREKVREFTLKDSQKEGQLKESADTHTWLNVDGLDNVPLMTQLGGMYEIPDTILSDIMNPSLRPQVEDFDNGYFLTLKMLQYNPHLQRVEIENLSVIVTESTLISFQEKPAHVFDPLRERIHKHTARMFERGTDYLCFALLDIVVDNYIYLINQLGEQIEQIEEGLTNDLSKQIPEQINSYKREMHFIRKSIKPAREVIFGLNKNDFEFIQGENRIHYKELQDNINEAMEALDSYRDILYDQLNTYHSIMATRLNDIMIILTMFSVVFIPLTFIVGVYGTNFEHIPELGWHYGYLFMWLLMVVVALGMLWFFKRKKWF